MNTLLLATTDSGSVIVAICIILLIGALTFGAMWKHDIDGALKIWAALGTLVGMVVGTMSTYFFTTGQVHAKDEQIKANQSVIVSTEKALNASEREKVQAGKEITNLAESLSTAAPQEKQQAVKKLEDVGKSLKDTSTIVPESTPAPTPPPATPQPGTNQPTAAPSP
jgi:hypothetical protein